MICPMVKGSPKARTCLLCGTELEGRRIKWCSDECSDTYWRHHAWGVARPAALRRDGWTCVRCGHVGWSDVPHSVLTIQHHDLDLDPPPTSEEDWAIALGLLDPTDLLPLREWAADSRRYNRIRTTTDRLPDSVKALVRSEHRRPRPWWQQPGKHELEVNHIVPREGRGYGNGCDHHLENLETLCRPCHVDETRRQRLDLPSWRHDPRPVEILLGRGVQEAMV